MEKIKSIKLEKKICRSDQIEKNIGLNIDPIGFLFKYDNRIFRAINNAEKDKVIFLFESGAIDELNKANLIPQTKISDIVLEGYDLVLEHRKLMWWHILLNGHLVCSKTLLYWFLR